MYKLSSLVYSDTYQKAPNSKWIPARPLNEDYKTLRQHIKEAWLVFIGKASAFTWE